MLLIIIFKSNEMKDFLKMTFATITGLLVTGFILTILGTISLVGMLISSDTEVKVSDNSVLRIDLKGEITERYESNPFDELFMGDIQPMGLNDILSGIKKAKNNDKIKGIYLNAEIFGCGTASLQEIRNALLDFKTSGKFIVAYGGMYTQGAYYLASVADKVIGNPSGNLAWHGVAANTMFFKEALKKIGVEMQIFRVGTYKSAVEPFLGTEMSPANREQTLAFASSIWNQMVNDVAASRKLSVEKLNELADMNMDYQEPNVYVKNGLVDTLMYKDQVLTYLKMLTGTSNGDKLKTISITDMKNVPNTVKNSSSNTIAVYYASGEIDNMSSTAMNEGINSEKVIVDLRKLREDKNIKAVVLRVNSPGGSAYGSEQIWREVALLKEAKPVVVSMGDYAASGGYYISCTADWIVAEPTTLTGSIGIFGMIPDASELITGKLGITMDGVKTNKLADLGRMDRPFNEDEHALIQNMVNNGYELFTKRCSEGRHIQIDELKKIAGGRVWTGAMAKDLKLVDQLGGIEDAIAVAAKRANLDGYRTITYPVAKDKLSALLDMTKPERYIQSQLQETMGGYYPIFNWIKNINNMDRVQARLPFELEIK